jgi:hypothetical protein
VIVKKENKQGAHKGDKPTKLEEASACHKDEAKEKAAKRHGKYKAVTGNVTGTE